ncbi:MAG: 50S ribosomal protein L30 [Leptonema sp. (in: bacteria)]
MSLKEIIKSKPKKIRVILKRSMIGKIPNHKATLKALGLTKIGKQKMIDVNNKPLMGMVKQVEYMLQIEVVE